VSQPECTIVRLIMELTLRSDVTDGYDVTNHNVIDEDDLSMDMAPAQPDQLLRELNPGAGGSPTKSTMSSSCCFNGKSVKGMSRSVKVCQRYVKGKSDDISNYKLQSSQHYCLLFSLRLYGKYDIPKMSYKY
jgi:hypothetical protein